MGEKHRDRLLALPATASAAAAARSRTTASSTGWCEAVRSADDRVSAPSLQFAHGIEECFSDGIRDNDYRRGSTPSERGALSGNPLPRGPILRRVDRGTCSLRGRDQGDDSYPSPNVDRAVAPVPDEDGLRDDVADGVGRRRDVCPQDKWLSTDAHRTAHG